MWLKKSVILDQGENETIVREGEWGESLIIGELLVILETYTLDDVLGGIAVYNYTNQAPIKYERITYFFFKVFTAIRICDTMATRERFHVVLHETASQPFQHVLSEHQHMRKWESNNGHQ